MDTAGAVSRAVANPSSTIGEKMKNPGYPDLHAHVAALERRGC